MNKSSLSLRETLQTGVVWLTIMHSGPKDNLVVILLIKSVSLRIRMKVARRFLGPREIRAKVRPAYGDLNVPQTDAPS